MPPGSGRKSKSKSSSGSQSSKSSKGSSSKSKSSKGSKSTSRSGSSIKKESKRPTVRPTVSPTTKPIVSPTLSPTPNPTVIPSASNIPSNFPSSDKGEPAPVGIGVCGMPTEEREDEVEAIIRQNTDDVSVLTDTNSPQSKAKKWLIETDELRVCPKRSLKVIQRYALAVFYYSTGGDEWGPSKAPTFLSDSDECDWYGVICDEDKGVNKCKYYRNPVIINIAFNL